MKKVFNSATSQTNCQRLSIRTMVDSLLQKKKKRNRWKRRIYLLPIVLLLLLLATKLTTTMLTLLLLWFHLLLLVTGDKNCKDDDYFSFCSQQTCYEIIRIASADGRSISGIDKKEECTTGLQTGRTTSMYRTVQEQGYKSWIRRYYSVHGEYWQILVPWWNGGARIGSSVDDQLRYLVPFCVDNGGCLHQNCYRVFFFKGRFPPLLPLLLVLPPSLTQWEQNKSSKSNINKNTKISTGTVMTTTNHRYCQITLSLILMMVMMMECTTSWILIWTMSNYVTTEFAITTWGNMSLTQTIHRPT